MAERKGMNLFQRIAGRLLKGLGYQSSNTLRYMMGGQTYAGKTVTPDTSMSITAVWACVRIIAETLGSLPVHVMRTEPSGNAVIASDLNVGDVFINSPNADMTSQEYREALALSMCLDGNAYSLIERNRTGVISLIPLEPSKVTVTRAGKYEPRIYRVSDGAGYTDYDQAQIWHIPAFGFNGLVGLSPIGLMRQAIGLAMAAEESGARFYGQGMRMGTVVEIPEWLETDKREHAIKKLMEQYAGLANAHKPFILEGGMKHVNVTMPLDDAQFIATRRFQIAEICRIYRMPLHMVQEMEGSTNNNIEWQGQSLATHTLMPYFTRIEQSFNKWLLTPADRAKGYFLRFNFEGLLRADTAARGEFYARMLQNGVYSRNEVRALENRSRVDGLDDYTVQTNLTPAALLSALAEAQINGNGGSNNA
jgi:HK97 family phage portal protein